MTPPDVAVGIHDQDDLTDFLIRYPEEMAFGDQDPGRILDRWFAPGFVFRNDGMALDRQRLIDHARPARRNARAIHVEVHSMMLSGNGIAAHYTLTATMRTAHVIATEIYLVGRLAQDARITGIDQCTRILTTT
ncbi:nuclear transport factor 2 family protein [Nocardia vaccinii]|uniref:nuclear transport factor 2 family protein n=1 Tax=Nocardia vaccinii TaxID=1822 RepID=UPI00082FED82|nr:nuclear transport factor 2 family protein [Nocardia vaccinii]